MNYHHAYHAGGAADILKHAVLALVLARLAAKPKPLAVLDAFAGSGLADLEAEAALATGEAASGIARLWPERASLPELAPFLGAVAACNPGGGWRQYPGSPLVALHGLRDGDRLILCETQDEPATALRRSVRGRSGVEVHQRDGWEAIRALLPPRERRGLLLLDPPFEKPGEMERLARALEQGGRRWPGAALLAWYPIKERAVVDGLHRAAAELPVESVLAIELAEATTGPFRLAGSGMVVVNPPWRFAAEAAPVLERMARILGQRLVLSELRPTTVHAARTV
ncbi:23S rRNA (adenine(2030)-N(6))-methyltransferase RlmJ [Zavarzinia sp. CC-PAN008]|uniref:23S rRNA (adenine(2030)-N(6))-methyltransferase RlmJ n=1 Tax=Zavarzinia sp. CC-PAN008 TaxID=3243332 RepID=UPI003F746627